MIAGEVLHLICEHYINTWVRYFINGWKHALVWPLCNMTYCTRFIYTLNLCSSQSGTQIPKNLNAHPKRWFWTKLWMCKQDIVRKFNSRIRHEYMVWFDNTRFPLQQLVGVSWSSIRWALVILCLHLHVGTAGLQLTQHPCCCSLAYDEHGVETMSTAVISTMLVFNDMHAPLSELHGQRLSSWDTTKP